MKMLVHYNALGTTVHGVWWINPATNTPEREYLDLQSPEAARAALIVYNKDNPEVTWSDWFDQLTTRAPYHEDWAVYDSMGMTPKQMLAALQPSLPLVS